MLELGLKSLLAYLLGAVIGSMVVGKLRGGVDIRTQGSGNAGGTNALRTQGVGFACWVMLIDVSKGLVAVTLVPALHLANLPPDPSIAREWLIIACAVSVVAGHVYPVWHDFRGGKGAATLAGVLAGLMPIALAPVLTTWILTVILTGFVGLATVMAAVAFPLFLVLRDAPPQTPLLMLAVLMAVFVTYTHRSNIRRMLAGNESRARRLWLLGRR